MGGFERQAVISGVGQSDVGRQLHRSPLSLTVDSVLGALADAGVEPGDVDGVMTYPGGGTAVGPGFSGPPVIDVCAALGLEPAVIMGNFEGPAHFGPLLNALLAVGSGLARHVVVYRTVTEGSARAAARRAGGEAGYQAAGRWFTAAGGGPGVIGWALAAQRHFHHYGTTRRQLAEVALNGRRHAALNPRAVYREPLTVDDYMEARMISDPLCLYDCDVHCDGSTAVVVSAAGYAADAPGPVVRVDAIGVAPSEVATAPYAPGTRPGRRAAEQLWARTDVTPADVDVAGIYDGFSILTLLWLEALGFCGPGESGPFVASGAIGPGGRLAVNTDGGQLSGGRLHGLGYLHEVCLQLRGGAGARQVPGAAVGLVAVGALPYVGCVLLRRDGP